MGYYDIPATIDYIMAITGEKLYYIGHSMGTTMLFVTTSARPEYNAKFRIAFALAPAAFLWKPRHQLLKALIPPSKQIAVCFLSNICVCVCVRACVRACTRVCVCMCNVCNIWKSFGLFVKTGMCCNETLVDETTKCRATYLITVC